MSDEMERIDNGFAQEAVNRFFRVCYKEITKQRGTGKFVEQDHQAVINCQHRLAEVMHIVYPTVTDIGE